MIYWRLLPRWLMRAWPALTLAPVGAAHFLAARQFPSDLVIVNKSVGMALQILGGLLVLYSVNDNLGLFKAQSLRATIVGWFLSFPRVRPPINLSVAMNASSSISASMSATVAKRATTLEERVAEVEREMSELRGVVQRNLDNVRTRIEEVRSELQRQVSETSNTVGGLSSRLEQSAVGGFKLQSLGVLLAIYGAVTSLFA